MFPTKTTLELKQHLSEKEIGVLWRVHQRSELQEYFFRTKTDLKWFYPIKLLGYLNPEAAPSPQPADKEGFYSTPQWIVLPYLESIAKQLPALPTDQRKRFEDELLEVIRQVSRKRQAVISRAPDDLELDNYRTWYFFTKILLHFNSAAIPIEILDLIPTWLQSKFDTTLPTSDLAEKLLPRFLGDGATEDDIGKAERIVNALTLFQWQPLPKRREYGLLGESEKPKLLAEDYWIFDSLVTHANARKVGARCSIDLLYLVGDRLNAILCRERPHWMEVKVEPHEYRLRVIEREPETYCCEFGLIEGGASEEDIFGKWDKFKTLGEFVVSSCPNATRFRDEVGRRVAALPDVSSTVVSKLTESLEEFYASLIHDHSYIWCKSLHQIETRGGHDAKETFTVVLRDLLLAKAEADHETAGRLLTDFWNRRYRRAIFKRLALYAIGKTWNVCASLFWRLVDQCGEELFTSSYFEPEVHQLLADNARSFTDEDKDRLAEIISRGPGEVPDDEYREKRISSWKQRWYSALRSDPRFQRLYDECLKVTQRKEKIRFNEPTVHWGPGPSPLTVEQILEKTNVELAQYISEFEQKPRHPIDDPNPEALAQMIKGAVLANPGKFGTDLSPFSNTGYRYVYELFWGFRDAFSKRPAIDWLKVLSFARDYIGRDDFWAGKYGSQDIDIRHATHEWVVGMVGELLQAGMRDDSWSFPAECDPVIRDIVSGCLSHLAPEPGEEEHSDPVSLSLNSSAGKIIAALFELSLRVARRSDSNSVAPRWDLDLKQRFEDALSKPFIEAHEILGRYLVNFYYLDKSWTERRVAAYLKEDARIWSSFVVGYLYSGTVYDELFVLMEPHYRKAISHAFKHDRAIEALCQHIGLGYLRSEPRQGLENSDSLVSVLLKTGTRRHIERLIGYIWMQRADAPAKRSRAVVAECKEGRTKPNVVETKDKTGQKCGASWPADTSQKVIALWRHMARAYGEKSSLNSAEREIVSDLAKFAVFLDELDDESVRWLLLSAEHVELRFNSTFLIEYLDRLKGVGDPRRNAGYIADIFLAMLRTFVPDFRKEHIQSLVEFIFSNGDEETQRKVADICNTYAQQGRESILREVYEKYRRNPMPPKA